MTAQLQFTAGGVTVNGNVMTEYVEPEVPGQFAHLRPAYTLPYTEAEVPMTYNADTGYTEGTVFDTSSADRTWLGTNVVTVKTVKTSGGDYTPAQYQTALNDAATANVTTVIVVDAGIVIPADIALPVKAGTPAWTYTVSAPFWNGSWTPTGQRYLNLDTELGNLFTLQQTASPGATVLSAIGAGRNRYGFIGCKIERTIA